MKGIGGTIVGIVVALLVGGGLYYYFSQQMTTQKDDLTKQVDTLKDKVASIEKNTNKVAQDLESQKQPTTASGTDTTATEAPTDTPAATTPTVTTTDWKTYSNTKYNYSVKYPKDWEYKDVTSSSGSAMNAIGLRPTAQKDTYATTFVVQKSTIEYSISQLKKTLAATSTFKAQSTADINGKSFTTLTFEDKTNTKVKPVYYLIAKDDLVYYFSTDTSADATANATTDEVAKSFAFAK